MTDTNDRYEWQMPMTDMIVSCKWQMKTTNMNNRHEWQMWTTSMNDRYEWQIQTTDWKMTHANDKCKRLLHTTDANDKWEWQMQTTFVNDRCNWQVQMTDANDRCHCHMRLQECKNTHMRGCWGQRIVRPIQECMNLYITGVPISKVQVHWFGRCDHQGKSGLRRTRVWPLGRCDHQRNGPSAYQSLAPLWFHSFAAKKCCSWCAVSECTFGRLQLHSDRVPRACLNVSGGLWTLFGTSKTWN